MLDKQPERIYLFNKKLDTYIFCCSLVVLIILSSMLRVYHSIDPMLQKKHRHKDIKATAYIENFNLKNE